MDTPCPFGAYVLATKYADGDPQDHWAVGFYAGGGPLPDRHQVVDGNGVSFRANGFRRVEMIAPEVGAWLLAHARALEQTPPEPVNLWDLVAQISFARR
jgi:hypothetical protein